ncbi:NfeD family protein [Magnetococcus sp. PR-3]|uniref:NfeD family protein n=1 Tax=Magnetococcus sp. PR-3 TaxID=3120355 RepID=UPI002FCDFB79
MSLIADIAPHWAWMIVGLVLIGLELFVWSTFLLWMGISAFLVGSLVYFIPEFPWQWSVLLYGILSLISTYVGRKLFKPAEAGDHNGLNERGHRMLGQVYLVEEAITHGRGKVRIGDSLWLAQGPDCEVGTPVKVMDVQSTTLMVERAE